mmetsp:Transcript_18377/g.37953  ORF Transcript_18377/g.37953 Transcript_18377/m.37953 type:complete len:214 (-) Transcript_18377:349-990(-)
MMVVGSLRSLISDRLRAALPAVAAVITTLSSRTIAIVTASVSSTRRVSVVSSSVFMVRTMILSVVVTRVLAVPPTALVSSTLVSSASTSSTLLTSSTSKIITSKPSICTDRLAKVAATLNFQFLNEFKFSTTSINILAEFNQLLGIFYAHVKDGRSIVSVRLDFSNIAIEGEIISLTAHTGELRHGIHDISRSNIAPQAIRHFNRSKTKFTCE